MLIGLLTPKQMSKLTPFLKTKIYMQEELTVNTMSTDEVTHKNYVTFHYIIIIILALLHMTHVHDCRNAEVDALTGKEGERDMKNQLNGLH